MQPLVARLADFTVRHFHRERVVETEARRRSRAHQPGLAQLIERVEHLLFGYGGGMHNHRELELAPDCNRQIEHLARVRRKRC